MRRLLPFLAALIVGLGTRIAVFADLSTGVPVQYASGWTIAAFPPGSTVSPVMPLTRWDPSGSGTVTQTARDGLADGAGYWVNFAADTDRAVLLGMGTTNPVSVVLGAGQSMLVGDPSGLWPAEIIGADAASVYDDANGWQPATMLYPGEGALVTSAAGGVVSVAPFAGAISDSPLAYHSPVVDPASITQVYPSSNVDASAPPFNGASLSPGILAGTGLTPATELGFETGPDPAAGLASGSPYGVLGAHYVEYHGNGLGPTLCANGATSHSSGRGTCSDNGGIVPIQPAGSATPSRSSGTGGGERRGR